MASIASATAIAVRGARTHNLKGVDVDLPRDALVVLTGVSGSGKSSLAFDTVFAEGQRRYVESLSSYARQFLDQLERPDVDEIDGLPPTVAIDQRAGRPNPRSTVGTLTEIHDSLRLLFSRLGAPHCPKCGLPIRSQTPEQMVATVLAYPTGRRILVLAPLVRGRKGAHADVFQAIRRAGLIRARVDGQVIEVDEPPKLAKTKNHSIDAVVDRLVIREGVAPRLAESLNLALKLSEGLATISAEVDGAWEDRPMSIHHACPDCGVSLPALEPRGFSFNSPQGACPRCDGLGVVSEFQPDLIVPDRARSLDRGAVEPWTKLGAKLRAAQVGDPRVSAFLDRHKLGRDVPLDDWPEAVFQAFLHGETDGGFAGVPAMLAELDRATDRGAVKAALAAYREEIPCPACKGARLRPESLAARVGGQSIAQVCDLTVEAARTFFDGLPFREDEQAVATPLLREIRGRLRFLAEVGLGYLTLGRGAATLSGGELQRVRLANQLGSDLVGVCYVLDEPTSGLHPRDTAQLLDGLRKLRDLGNSVLVVEHDEAVIRAADWVVDVGPGAGPEGGAIVAVGPPGRIAGSAASLTGRRLRGEDRHAPSRSDRLARSPGWLTIRGSTVHNLRTIDVRIPLGTLTCVTGVSGSGKSTLVFDVLARAFRRRDRASLRAIPELGTIAGWDSLTAMVEIDQAPIGRTPRSTPATFTGVFDEIRRVFAKTREARTRGYGPPRFSFNAKGGRCETCQGLGRRRVPMQFLPDLYVVCEDCRGKRFNRQTLEILFKEKSIGDVLDLRVDEALAFFDAQPRVLPGLRSLHDVGVGYLTLGQSGATLSGGEAQRVKLAAHLNRPAGGERLYILDEPTTGLHFADVDRLLGVLERLADQGDTLVVIEHNLDVVAAADWVVDLGPEAGSRGGRVVAMGTPAEIAAAPESLTGAYLRTDSDRPAMEDE
ncbi:excinuclease ABC subunit UvrA [Paludisphaera mucosa]|uniref:UvrABC system protein A n=1 Tax=Paludisphaera mucosa TaxID=3030827 RepID=A0ABT6F449_9BACT|nr:excinuclease ABC subunit UvrA [Paludisphaera mucosa]MDG3002345.1 excinuclease ABC subunit UvrA [Paludisphaera mucosa]